MAQYRWDIRFTILAVMRYIFYNFLVCFGPSFNSIFDRDYLCGLRIFYSFGFPIYFFHFLFGLLKQFSTWIFRMSLFYLDFNLSIFLFGILYHFSNWILDTFSFLTSFYLLVSINSYFSIYFSILYQSLFLNFFHHILGNVLLKWYFDRDFTSWS